MQNGLIAKSIKDHSNIYNMDFWNGLIEVWDNDRFMYKVRLQVDRLNKEDALQDAKWHVEQWV